MRKLSVQVDVTDAVDTGERLSVAATVALPDGPEPKSVAMFAFPGGGYNRHYYDLHLPEGPGYSQADHHAAQGFVFVGIDHLGVGDSDMPTQALDYEAVARANDKAAAEIFERVVAGTLDAGVAPIGLQSKVAMGQSFGGFILTIGQAIDGYFDGVALLGWSKIETQPPWDNDVSLEAMMAGTAGSGLEHPMRRTFHYPDVPESIVIADMTKEPGTMASSAPWSAAHSPGGPAVATTRGPLGPGAVAKEAAAITVPAFIASGEIDVIADIHSEAIAYGASPDLTLCTYKRMAHMHNFASTRHRLWERLARWAEGVDQTVSESRVA